MAKAKQIHQADIVARFGRRLREVRLARSLTQAELAEQVQVSVNYIGRLEKGSTTPGVDLVDRLAAALDTTVADLLPGVGAPNTVAMLKDRARKLFEGMMKTEDQATLVLLTQLPARLSETAAR